MTQYDEWRFYAKDGTTLRASVRACLKGIPYEGVVSKTFSWMLESRADFDKLIDLCRFAEGAYSSRTAQSGELHLPGQEPRADEHRPDRRPERQRDGILHPVGLRPGQRHRHGGLLRLRDLGLLARGGKAPRTPPGTVSDIPGAPPGRGTLPGRDPEAGIGMIS